jgi:arylsulfatase
MPNIHKGVEQYLLSGVSMRYTFDAKPDDPTRKKRQYYAMLGSRGIWENGWKASAIHPPAPSNPGNYEKDQRELYHVDVDRSESNDLVRKHPEKLQALIKAWFEEAEKNLVLPLDDRTIVEIFATPRPAEEEPRERYIYYPGTSAVPESVAVNVRARSYKILAAVETADSNCSGVIFAHGSRFGGHSLFIKDKKLYYVYNFLGIKPEQKFVSPELKPGKYTLGVEFTREKAGPRNESADQTKLYVNDEVVAEGPMRARRWASSRCAATGFASGSTARIPSARNTRGRRRSKAERSSLLASPSRRPSISTWRRWPWQRSPPTKSRAYFRPS